MWRLRLSLLLDGLEHKWQMCFSFAWSLRCRVKLHFWPKNTPHSLQRYGLQSAISYVNNDLGTHNMYGDTSTNRQVVQCAPFDFLWKNALAYSSHLIYSLGRVHFLIGLSGGWGWWIYNGTFVNHPHRLHCPNVFLHLNNLSSFTWGSLYSLQHSWWFFETCCHRIATSVWCLWCFFLEHDVGEVYCCPLLL